MTAREALKKACKIAVLQAIYGFGVTLENDGPPGFWAKIGEALTGLAKELES